MTSSNKFGEKDDVEYAEALLEAQKQTGGPTLTWYFLESKNENVHPSLKVSRPEKAEAVVSIKSCTAPEFGRNREEAKYDTWSGGQADLDKYISDGGRHGRLAEAIRAGGPVAFHTHWQTMYSRGTYNGLKDLEKIAERINKHFGDQVCWTRCDDLARYTAAAETTTMRCALINNQKTLVLNIDAAFDCHDFTLSLGIDRDQHVKQVSVDGQPLQPLDSDSATESLTENHYTSVEDRLTLCWLLMSGRHQIHVEFDEDPK